MIRTPPHKQRDPAKAPGQTPGSDGPWFGPDARRLNERAAELAKQDVTCAGPVRCQDCHKEEPALIDDVARRLRCLVRDYPF